MYSCERGNRNGPTIQGGPLLAVGMLGPIRCDGGARVLSGRKRRVHNHALLELHAPGTRPQLWGTR
jgi:hypothetical protein